MRTSPPSSRSPHSVLQHQRHSALRHPLHSALRRPLHGALRRPLHSALRCPLHSALRSRRRSALRCRRHSALRRLSPPASLVRQSPRAARLLRGACRHSAVSFSSLWGHSFLLIGCRFLAHMSGSAPHSLTLMPVVCLSACLTWCVLTALQVALVMAPRRATSLTTRRSRLHPPSTATLTTTTPASSARVGLLLVCVVGLRDASCHHPILPC
jgi:hypothetical protein